MSDTRNHPRLRSGFTYHICNQGNNQEDIFKEERNYAHFLEKYKVFIHPICHTYAYCLMPNHFHLLVQFKPYQDLHLAFPTFFQKPSLRARNASDLETATELEFDEQMSLKISN